MPKNKSQKSKRPATKASNNLGILPLGDRVLIAPLSAEEMNKTKSGIIIPETVSQEKPHEGKVLAVGTGKMNEGGSARIPMTVKVGERVIFSKYAPNEIKVDGVEYYIISESDILAIID